MKTVVLDGFTLNPGDITWDRLKEISDVTLYDRTPKDEVIKRIGDAEIILTNKTPITKEVMDNTNIKYIGVLATGFNVVDVKYAAEKGIVVTNVPIYGTDAVAQFTFGLLLAICHHIGEHSQAVYAGEWENNIDWCFWKYPLIELANKTMGIIGYGRIGKSVAKIAKAFNMNVVYFDNYADGSCELGKKVELDELLKVSDVITLHCPLTDETNGIINKDSIAKMKDGVIILNASRGPLIVEQDLVDALESGKVAYSGSDVVSTEPIQGTNPLLKAKNCIITPHIAWATKEARERLMNVAVDNVKAFIDGNPINKVN